MTEVLKTAIILKRRLWYNCFQCQLREIKQSSEEEFETFLVLVLYMECALILFYRELVASPGKCIPEFESDIAEDDVKDCFKSIF